MNEQTKMQVVTIFGGLKDFPSNHHARFYDPNTKLISEVINSCKLPWLLKIQTIFDNMQLDADRPWMPKLGNLTPFS